MTFFIVGVEFRVVTCNRDVGDHLDNLEKMIKGDNGIEQHEKRLRYAKDILERPRSLGLEVFHAIISHVADGTTGERRESQSGHRRNSEIRELLLQNRKRIAFGAMSRASLEDCVGV